MIDLRTNALGADLKRVTQQQTNLADYAAQLTKQYQAQFTALNALMAKMNSNTQYLTRLFGGPTAAARWRTSDARPPTDDRRRPPVNGSTGSRRRARCPAWKPHSRPPGSARACAGFGSPSRTVNPGRQRAHDYAAILRRKCSVPATILSSTASSAQNRSRTS